MINKKILLYLFIFQNIFSKPMNYSLELNI